jgi:hypothetical protein
VPSWISRRERSRGPRCGVNRSIIAVSCGSFGDGGGGNHEYDVASVGPFEIPCTHGVLRPRCARLAHTLSTVPPPCNKASKQDSRLYDRTREIAYPCPTVQTDLARRPLPSVFDASIPDPQRVHSGISGFIRHRYLDRRAPTPIDSKPTDIVVHLISVCYAKEEQSRKLTDPVQGRGFCSRSRW